MTDKSWPVKIISYWETSKSVFWFWFWGWEIYFDASQDAVWCLCTFIQPTFNIQPTDCFKFISVEWIISGLGVPIMSQATFIKPILWKNVLLLLSLFNTCNQIWSLMDVAMVWDSLSSSNVASLLKPKLRKILITFSL